MGKFKVVKKITKNWTSGYTTFSVVSDMEHVDRNYIVMNRILVGRPPEKQQFFNFHLEDWIRLKDLIESETAEEHKWPIQKITSSQSEILSSLEKILGDDPDFLQKILSNKNIANLTGASLEALDKLGLRVFEIKAENLEIILKKLSEAGEDELNNFVSLLNELKIGQINSIAELVQKKIAIIKLLENLVKDKGTKEKEIHKLLESNLWLLDNSYDLVKSDKPLSDYLSKEIKEDPDLGKRPDLIVKMFLQDENHVVIVELKRPSVKIKADHIGQILGYKGIIQNHNPSIKIIDIFLIGFDLDPNMPKDLKDLKVELLESIINKKKKEFNEFLEILEDAKEDEYNIF